MKNAGRDNLLFLGEILKRDEVEYGSNNLIVSPTGSGKTYHMMNDLRDTYIGKTLMLVSTSSLKDALGGLEETYTTQDVIKSKSGIDDDDVYLMSYSEFGYKILWNSKFLDGFELILCDEIHSLIEYYTYNKAHNLGIAIRELFSRHEDKVIFYYTATTARLDDFIDNTYEDLYENVSIFNYERDKDIVRYKNVSTVEIFDIEDMEDSLLSLKEMREYRNCKGFVYNERISGMGKIKDMLNRLGFRAIEIWSIHNEKYEMTTEQLRARNILLTENRIPDEYDFVIMNGSMREGWELKDSRVKVGILNTHDETDKVQARGRLRGDLAVLIVRAEGGRNSVDVSIMNKERELSIVEKVLGKELDSIDRDALAYEFRVRDGARGRIVKWPTIAKTLRENGYKIEDRRVRRDGRHLRVQIITRVEEKATPSIESKSKQFMRRIGETKFGSVNEDALKKYVGSEQTAYSHMKSSYIRFVGNEKWTERKFADVTYLLARDNKLFVSVNYVSYGLDYRSKEEIEVLTERAKYEVSSVRLLEAARAKQKEIEAEMECELLKYLAAQQGVEHIEDDGVLTADELRANAKKEEERLARYVEANGGLRR